jgi:transposase InsO family protein
VRFTFIHQHQTRWPIDVLCRVLGVTRAGYYHWRDRPPSKSKEKQDKIAAEIRRIHSLPRFDDYGSPRVHAELVKSGVRCSENTVAKLMKRENIRARAAPRFRVATTDSKHDLPIAPNRLDQQFQAQTINQVWLTDFTYIKTKEGFVYLCTVEDLCSRRIVGWDTSRNIDARLALAALDQAIALRGPEPGLIVHSDRGSQFASQAFRTRLQQQQFLQSMSRKGNCHDNAPMESFFRSFKVEEVSRQHYDTFEQATRAAVDYIERFYNRVRAHSALQYQSPIEFEQQTMPGKTRKP